MFFINFEGFVKPQLSLDSLILNLTNYVLCFHYEYHLNFTNPFYSFISNAMQHMCANAPLLVLQSTPCSNFGHTEPVTFSCTHRINEVLLDQEESHGGLTVREGPQAPFPIILPSGVGMAKASVCCSTCGVSFQAETQPALLSFAGNEGANYMANLHAPMQRAVFQAYRIIY